MSAADLLQGLLSVIRWGTAAFGALLVLGTLLSETRYPHWPVRLWDFPRSQMAVVMTAIACVYPLLAWWDGFGSAWNWLLPAVLLAATVRQAMWIWPYVGPADNDLKDASDDRDEDATIRVVISNVLMENDDYERWRNVITDADADLVLAAETTQKWIDEINKALADSHPHQKLIPQDNYYGMGVWSRLPFKDLEVDHIVQDDIPSIHLTLTLKDGRDVRMHGLHPRPPAPQMGDSSAPRDAELVLVGQRIKERRQSGGTRPTLVLGDLNDVAWSRTTDLFLRISGMLDPRRGRGFFNSFHAEHWWVRFPLDHVFVSDDFRLIEMKRLDYVGSDHFPMFIALSLEPEKAHQQEKHDLDEGDEAEAEAMVDEQVEREQEGEEHGHLATDGKDEAGRQEEAQK